MYNILSHHNLCSSVLVIAQVLSIIRTFHLLIMVIILPILPIGPSLLALSCSLHCWVLLSSGFFWSEVLVPCTRLVFSVALLPLSLLTVLPLRAKRVFTGFLRASSESKEQFFTRSFLWFACFQMASKGFEHTRWHATLIQHFAFGCIRGMVNTCI